MKGMGYTQKTLGEAIHMSETTMNKSLTNKRRFSQDEMEAICDVLGIPRSSIDEYFFCRETLEI
jgi:transcriptional regulator with XRE-family HTH domain